MKSDSASCASSIVWPCRSISPCTRPLAAPQLLQDVGGEAAAQERLLGLLLLPDVPGGRRGLRAVLGRGQRVGVVGDALPRDRRGPRRRVRDPLARRAASARRQRPARDRIGDRSAARPALRSGLRRRRRRLRCRGCADGVDGSAPPRCARRVDELLQIRELRHRVEGVFNRALRGTPPHRAPPCSRCRPT